MGRAHLLGYWSVAGVWRSDVWYNKVEKSSNCYVYYLFKLLPLHLEG